LELEQAEAQDKVVEQVLVEGLELALELGTDMVLVLEQVLGMVVEL
jgi:hypothetical protein